uniref:Uncharacterized protein n=1 Tax=Rhizophagus irregularis (strain DAOM 181602 / DAOM 197198 / MUCL 43194) TaxID=747089 RepID=U9SW45_RHIID
MTETANQLLNRVTPICTCQVPGSTNTTEPAYSRFQYVMREWQVDAKLHLYSKECWMFPISFYAPIIPQHACGN